MATPENSIAQNICLIKRKIADEYVRLCGYGHGRPEKESKMDCLTLKQIASQLGTSEGSLKRSLRIERNLSEDMKQLLDEGVISETLAVDETKIVVNK